MEAHIIRALQTLERRGKLTPRGQRLLAIAMRPAEGSPAEEASKTPEQEAAEVVAGPGNN